MSTKLEDARAEGRSLFHSTVSKPGVNHRTGAATAVLKRSDSNKKLGGGVWTKGMFKGMPLYSLTLEERATCQTDCQAWDICYGNNMPWATRFDHRDVEGLMEQIEDEVDQLSTRHPRGFSVRLHILGDFFSVAYVHFWGSLLTAYPQLRVYGYTHRTGEIGAAIDEVYVAHPGRFVIMQSDGDAATTNRPVALLETTAGADRLPACPKETGRTASCFTCGLCTNPNIKGVRFLLH